MFPPLCDTHTHTQHNSIAICIHTYAYIHIILRRSDNIFREYFVFLLLASAFFFLFILNVRQLNSAHSFSISYSFILYLIKETEEQSGE